MANWPDPDSNSKKLYDRGLKVMPGGITRIAPWLKPFPVYAGRGEGAYVVDVDGRRRLDFLNNFASLIHGHAHPAVVKAVQERVALGTAFTLPTETEVVLAETISERAPGLEWVRFCGSGSEAVMSAIKAARALTGRPKIVKCEGSYHGAYDYAEVSIDSTPENWGNDPRSVGYSVGVPKGVTDDVIVIPFNDLEAAERIIRANRADIACVLLDPAPSYLAFAQATPAFAQLLRRLTREIGALLVLDEVISFRVHPGGAQTLMGIDPDLTTLAKIIGGGFPVGAVAGRREVMKVYDHRPGKPPLPWSGTFTANPVTMVAGKVTLDLLDQAAIDRMDRLGERLRQGVAQALKRNGFPGQITGFSSMFTLLGHQRPVTDYRSAYAHPPEAQLVEKLQSALVLEGHHLAKNGMGVLSTPMGEAEVDSFVDAMDRITARGL